MDLNLLLTDEQYQEKFAGKHATPYIYELLTGNQALFYFGVRHSRKPNDPQWSQLADAWEKFLATSGDKRIIMFEGGKIPTWEGARDESISKFGESGALLFQAQNSGAEFSWPDPTMSQEADHLHSLFGASQVAYFFFARSAGAWLRSGTMGTFEEVLAKAAAATTTRIPGTPTDVSAYKAMHEKVFGHPLEPARQDVLIRASAPVYHDSIINDIARADSRFRNERVVTEVESFWKKGYSIFMLFGAAHAVIQEPALRALVNG